MFPFSSLISEFGLEHSGDSAQSMILIICEYRLV